MKEVLNFDRFSWTTGSSKPYLSPTNLPLKIPAGKGHSLLARRVREMWETIAVPVAQKFEQKPTAIARKGRSLCWVPLLNLCVTLDFQQQRNYKPLLGSIVEVKAFSPTRY
ncbi:hypothetical protein ACSBR1_029551 [Camellia fascicularis]